MVGLLDRFVPESADLHLQTPDARLHVTDPMGVFLALLVSGNPDSRSAMVGHAMRQVDAEIERSQSSRRYIRSVDASRRIRTAPGSRFR